MNIERAIEFLIKNQARMDARFNAKFDRAEKRLDRLERVLTQNNRLVTQIGRAGVSLRSDVRKASAESEVRFSRIEKGLEGVTERLAETSDKLNALIDLVDRHVRGNGHRHGT